MPDYLSQTQYQQLRDFFSREFGLFFEPNKLTFLENRVLPLMHELKCLDLNHFILEVQGDEEKRARLLNELTTNETWFFRHPRHFDILRDDILPPLIREGMQHRKREISVWSAGGSIGAEAFSIAITLQEALRELSEWRVTIVCSDISRAAIQRAQEGIYSLSELRLLSNTLLTRHFIPLDAERFQVKPELRSLIQFEHLNLVSSWPQRDFDIIFCRNTMIYFREATKKALTERFYRVLKPGGYFFISPTETIHWSGENEVERLFLRGEYVYRKRVQARDYLLYEFHSPSDLLRALNLLVKASIEYHLRSVPPRGPGSPKRALFFPRSLGVEVESLLTKHGVQTAAKSEFSE
ncbi:MAG TPA: protein-glutamate O-methyltransferase CheR [Candidatus Ozemobacteraceae bacterium]|nr:protein-glutamate O-methyltransferase CheR [Candidatus Ozemobacteraceae bacterium]